MNASSLKNHWKIWCHSWRPPWGGMPIPCKSKQCSFPSMTTNLKVPKASKWRCRCQNVARHQPTTTPPGAKNVTGPVIETVAWVMIMKRQGAASWIMAIALSAPTSAIGQSTKTFHTGMVHGRAGEDPRWFEGKVRWSKPGQAWQRENHGGYTV